MEEENWNVMFSQNPVMYSDVSKMWKYLKLYILNIGLERYVLDIGCGIGFNSTFFFRKRV